LSLVRVRPNRYCFEEGIIGWHPSSLWSY
jgi:hypothetical protein